MAASPTIKHIGVWRPGGIGDVLLAAQGLAQIRRRFPDAHIHVWGHTEGCYLLLQFGLADSIGDHRQGFRLHDGVPDALIAWEWNVATFRQDVENFGIPHIGVFEWIAPKGWHQSQWLMNGMGSVLGFNAMVNPELAVGVEVPEVIQRANQRWQGHVLLHAGSSMFPKRYPHGRMLRLAGMLRESGYRVVFVEGPEDDYGDTGDIPVLTRPFIDIAYLLHYAHAYIGGDTGATHLAGMMGIPTVALFGPSQPKTWGPIGPFTRTLNLCPRMANTDEVWYDANHECFKDLHPHHIMAALREVLGKADADLRITRTMVES